MAPTTSATGPHRQYQWPRKAISSGFQTFKYSAHRLAEVFAADDPTNKLYRTVRRWWNEIEVLIVTGATTGKVEANNNGIKHIKRTARGHRNPANYKSVILMRSPSGRRHETRPGIHFPMNREEPVNDVIASFPTCHFPEVARLGRTLRAWKAAILAHFETYGASNGPTEAINGVIETNHA